MLDRFDVNDPKVAAIFASPQAGRIVQSLIDQPMSLSDLADVTNMAMSLLHYHIAKCVKLGLVEVVATQPRAGRGVKLYQAVARNFFVPSDLLPRMPGGAMHERLRTALEQSQARSIMGVHYCSEDGHPRILLVRDPDIKSQALELWLDIGLSEADRHVLFQDLQALMARYRDRATDDAQHCLVHVAVARIT
jgi:DNA-binding transcriptional ArsR family regulator